MQIEQPAPSLHWCIVVLFQLFRQLPEKATLGCFASRQSVEDYTITDWFQKPVALLSFVKSSNGTGLKRSIQYFGFDSTYCPSIHILTASGAIAAREVENAYAD